METFPRYWPFVLGIHRSPVNSPHKGQWRGALMFSLICAWTRGWVNNRDADDLRRHRAHYDVTVIGCLPLPLPYSQMEKCIYIYINAYIYIYIHIYTYVNKYICTLAFFAQVCLSHMDFVWQLQFQGEFFYVNRTIAQFAEMIYISHGNLNEHGLRFPVG